MILLQAIDLGKRTTDRWLVQPTSFALEAGCRLGIAGASGAGKSTLLKMLAGLLQPDGGELRFKAKPVLGPLYKLLPGHPEMAYLSQHFELRNNYLVADYLDYGNVLPPQDTQTLVELCGIGQLLQRKTNSGLSGGEKQRVALAKILLKRPRLLLLDEPFSNLDHPHKTALKAILRQLQAQLGVDIVLASHDAQDLLPWAHRILVMQNGAVLQDADPTTLFFRPKNAYVAGLMGPYNAIAPGCAPHAGTTPGRLLLRPGQIVVGESGLAAAVTDIQFFGTYDLVTALANGCQYLAQTPSGACCIGQAVGLTFPETESWYI
jgi:ABC-type sulfate/molybdate transport systems ATPase subunit